MASVQKKPTKRRVGRPNGGHGHNEMVAVWNSFEWLFREKLEAMDHMARTMIQEMVYSGANMTQIRRFVPLAFAQLWERVAAEQEEREPERKRG